MLWSLNDRDTCVFTVILLDTKCVDDVAIHVLVGYTAVYIPVLVIHHHSQSHIYLSWFHLRMSSDVYRCVYISSYAYG